ncbi:MAG: hypothetical protein RMM31_03705 [Anaerolineae bacterium]|nr:hypothetical protein [Anaerolineae bacterium]
MSEPLRPKRFWVVVLTLLVALALGVLMHPLRFDDPFITYRVADNLARGNGFVFNPNEERALITTAPLYALLLAIPARLGADLPTTSNALSVVASALASLGLLRLGWVSQAPLTGFLAGIFFLLAPMTWLTLGFETLPFLATSVWAIVLTQSRQLVWAGMLLGFGIGLRGDGALVALVCGLHALREARTGGMPLHTAVLYAPARLGVGATLTYLPLALYLTAQFGSPLPTTLQTKTAQAVSGLTGFYPGTSFLEGAMLIASAYAKISPLFVLLLPIAALGAWQLRRAPLALWMPIAWAGLHLAGYSLIGVAPYTWYYAPLLPGLALLLAAGIASIAAPPALRVGLAGLIAAPMLAANARVIGVLNGDVPPPPSELISKVLPETKVYLYERVGRWIAAHTPTTATLGVTELGVMGFYAQRHTTDFLGLTDRGQLDAIRRGDFIGGLIRSQPDWLALTSVNALYDAHPPKDAWFRALYRPAAQFDDPRFWGSPMTVWQRIRPPTRPEILLAQGERDLGEGWQVTGVAANTRVITQGTLLLLSVRLRAGVLRGARELRVQPVVLGGGDGLAVVSRLIYTQRFRPNEEAWYDFPLPPLRDMPKRGAYEVSIRWLDGGPEVFAGRLKVPLDATAPPDARWQPLSAEVHVAALGKIAACSYGTSTITLLWRGGQPLGLDYHAFLHVRDASGTIIAQHDSPPRTGTYPTSVWSLSEVIPDEHPIDLKSVPPGQYDIVVGLYDPVTQQRLPVVDSPARTPDGGVKLGVLEVRLCQ